MLFLPGVVPIAAASAGAGPLWPAVFGGLSAASLLWKLFGGGGNQKPPAPTPTNPVTGQPVPLNPDGTPWGIDTHTGLPGDLTSQIWNLGAPEGLSIGNMTAEQYVQGGLPFWATNRLQSVAKDLGGWDKMISWLYDPKNWSQILTVLGQPWGQGSYDTMPEGTQVNEGQTTQYPEGQQPDTSTGDPTFRTDTVGAPSGDVPYDYYVPPSYLDQIAQIVGAMPPTGGSPTVPGETPLFSATGYGNFPYEDYSQGGNPQIAANPPAPSNPTFSVTGTGAMPTVPTQSSPILGGLPELSAGLLPGSQPSGSGGGYNSNNGGILGGILGAGLGAAIPGIIGSFLPGGNPSQPGQSQQPGQSALPQMGIIAPQTQIATPAPMMPLAPQSPVQSLFQQQPFAPQRIPSLTELLNGR